MRSDPDQNETVSPSELSKLSLAELTAQRICHDLSSTIGAVRNGLELMELEIGTDMPSMGLMSSASQGAVASLNLLRLGFGPSDPSSMITAHQFQQLISEAYAQKNHVMDFDLRDMTRTEARALALMVLCLCHVMPYGGDLLIAKTASQLRISAHGRIHDETEAMLELLDSLEMPVLSPDQVQFMHLHQVIAEAVYSVQVTRHVEGIDLILN